MNAADSIAFPRPAAALVARAADGADARLVVAFVNGRTSPVTLRQPMQWSELVARLSRSEPGEKDGPGWLPADIAPGPRTRARVEHVSALVLDVDGDDEAPAPPIVDILGELDLWGTACLVHTSYSHAHARPKYRLVFQVSRPIWPRELRRLAEHVAGGLGLTEAVDTACMEPARLFYLPRCPVERLPEFEAHEISGLPLDVDALLADATAIERANKAPAQINGARSVGVIQAFNEAHDIATIIERAGYERRPGDRWLWPGSETGMPGVRRLEDGRVYSSHRADPLHGEHTHDAFGCWTILQHGGDQRAAVKAAASLLGLDRARPAPHPPEPTAADGERSQNDDATLQGFYAYLPGHTYLCVMTGDLWPAASVDGHVLWPQIDDKPMRPSRWLDRNRAVHQLTWQPGEPQIITDRVVLVSGWSAHEGSTVYNLYRPPAPLTGDAAKAGPWREHLRRVYPEHAEHIECWLAHRIQRPGDKLNHALVLGGAQGIGKDTLLEPVKRGVGAWNWQDISPAMLTGRFNGFVKCVVLRISEARDLGDVDRYGFYEHCKTVIAAPPDVLRVDEKNLREHYVPNVCGVIFTTNNRTDGLYLPADDRRHFVAWSDAKRDDFPPDYWTNIYRWYSSGGIGHVVAYLQALDLSGFDAKAPPEKTAAFWAMVQAGEAPESGELRDVIDSLRAPAALTIGDLIEGAESMRMHGLGEELKDRKNRRSMPHKLERVGYVPVRNPDAEDGLFKVGGRRQAVYAKRTDNLATQIRSARSRSV